MGIKDAFWGLLSSSLNGARRLRWRWKHYLGGEADNKEPGHMAEGWGLPSPSGTDGRAVLSQVCPAEINHLSLFVAKSQRTETRMFNTNPHLNQPTNHHDPLRTILLHPPKTHPHLTDLGPLLKLINHTRHGQAGGRLDAVTSGGPRWRFLAPSIPGQWNWDS